MRPLTVAAYAPARLADGRWVPGWKPRVHELEWSALCRVLTYHREAADKARVECWAPHRLSEPHRCAANVVSLDCVVLDLDSGAPLCEQLAPWEPFAHVWHTTWSHSCEHPAARVVLPLVAPVPASAWRRAWTWAQKRGNGMADEAAKDGSRLYFLPSSPASTRDDRDSQVVDGPWLEIPSYVLAEPPPRRPHRRPVYSAANVRSALRDDPTARRRLAELLGARIQGAGETERATRAPCPSCGKASVWWWVDPTRARWARCDHVQSCGWTGPLDQLAKV